jgi:uncharacterized surface protein with fasciclin (FAS1) repeats
LQTIPELSSWVYLLRRAGGGLSDILTCGGSSSGNSGNSLAAFTVLAPTNNAWNAQAVHNNATHLTQLLRHDNLAALQERIMDHIVPGQAIDSATTQKLVSSLSGRYIHLQPQSAQGAKNSLSFNGVVGQEYKKAACNGIIYLLDAIMPEESTASGTDGTLYR